jgi:hypothetical protein
MKTRMLAACAALATAVSGMAFATSSASAAASHARPDASASSCKYRQAGSHWVCITPGARCPAAAHNHYGLITPGKLHRSPSRPVAITATLVVLR